MRYVIERDAHKGEVFVSEAAMPKLRLALWTRSSAATGRSLGKRLRSLRWADAARRGQR